LGCRRDAARRRRSEHRRGGRMLRTGRQLPRRARPLRRVGGCRRDRAASPGSCPLRRGRGAGRPARLAPAPRSARPAEPPPPRRPARRGIIMTTGCVPPPYPYERLGDVIAIAEQHAGGAINLSIGTPCDPAPADVIAALSTVDGARTYPSSIGSQAFREAA